MKSKEDKSIAEIQSETMEKQSKKFKLITSVSEIITSFLLLVCGCVITLAILNVYISKQFGVTMFSLNDILKDITPFLQAEKFIETSFYTDYDQNTLLDSAIDSYVSALDDKYSRYENAEARSQSEIKDAGQRIGIGITVQLTDDNYMKIAEVTEGSPSEEAGIKVDDIIKTIDGNDVAQYGYSESISLISNGDTDTPVNFIIQRGEEELEISVNRTILEVTSADGIMLDNNIGYIKLSHFYANTPEQFNAIYQELLEQGATGFIFDLRNNTGGFTNSVQGCLNDLVPKGNIAEATYKNGSTKTIVKSDSDKEITVPSVIITNEYTASAGEIFSSAMRELEGSILVGENTYGKGVMQVTQPLSNGGAVTLTVATYNIVGHECYHGIGLAPDYEVSLDENATEDTQLNKAIEVITDLINNQ